MGLAEDRSKCPECGGRVDWNLCACPKPAVEGGERHADALNHLLDKYGSIHMMTEPQVRDLLSHAIARIRELEADNARLHKTPCLPGKCDREECWIRACRAAGVLAQVVREMNQGDRDRVMSLGVDALLNSGAGD